MEARTETNPGLPSSINPCEGEGESLPSSSLIKTLTPLVPIIILTLSSNCTGADFEAPGVTEVLASKPEPIVSLLPQRQENEPDLWIPDQNQKAVVFPVTPTSGETPPLTEFDARLDSRKAWFSLFQQGENTTYYVIQKGNNLSEIARIFFDGSLNNLLELNSSYENNPSLIHSGNLVRLPDNLILGGISFWDAPPRLNNKWIEPGQADPSVRYKEVVLHDYNEGFSFGTEKLPYTVIRLGYLIK